MLLCLPCIDCFACFFKLEDAWHRIVSSQYDWYWVSLIMNLHRTYLLFTSLCLFLLCSFYLHSRITSLRHDSLGIPAKQILVKALGLTDLAIWSEARYTRHPSLSDQFAAFQDLPSAMEHFPAGSMMAPPQHGLDTEMSFRRSINEEGE